MGWGGVMKFFLFFTIFKDGRKNHYIFYQGKCLFTVLNYGYLRMMSTIADEVRTITPTTPPDTKPMVNDASELFA